ncbi:MAG: DUF4282 domain-containing protein [Bacillota bacterium]
MNEQEYKKCPFCGEQIKSMAIKCKHCHAFIDQSEPENRPTEPQNNLDNHKQESKQEHFEPVNPNLHHQDKSFFASLFDLSMSEMITPKIIRIFYVIGLLVIGLGALGVILGSLYRGTASFFISMIGAPLGALIAVIILRIYLELIINFFNIYKELRQINKNLPR